MKTDHPSLLKACMRLLPVLILVCTTMAVHAQSATSANTDRNNTALSPVDDAAPVVTAPAADEIGSVPDPEMEKAATPMNRTLRAERIKARRALRNAKPVTTDAPVTAPPATTPQ